MDSGFSEPVTGFVLAGGQSNRMGRDKALLQLPAGETLLRHALALASAVTGRVMLVGPRTRYSEFAPAIPIVEDLYPGRGPLGGIHAALLRSETELNLVLGVDCPRVTPELLRFLLHVAAGTSALITVPRIAGYLHTVCAVYRRAFAPSAGRVLVESMSEEDEKLARNARHRVCIERLITAVPHRIIEESELLAAGFGPELFANVNTPEEFQALTDALKLQI